MVSAGVASHCRAVQPRCRHAVGGRFCAYRRGLSTACWCIGPYHRRKSPRHRGRGRQGATGPIVDAFSGHRHRAPGDGPVSMARHQRPKASIHAIRVCTCPERLLHWHNRQSIHGLGLVNGRWLFEIGPAVIPRPRDTNFTPLLTERMRSP